jgi:glycerol-3-phosphate dehydrogenase
LIVVGGGIYGAMLSLEASRRGLRPLLLERNDFGSGTSFNSLRIIHGGLRYLQSLDLSRFFESVRERRWFLKTFPDLVEPLPCLMPLYGRGLRTRSVLSVALQMNDALSWRRNRQVEPIKHLPGGRIIGPQETKELFPMVDGNGLQGAAIWYDAAMLDSPRLVMEVLRWSCSLGATVLNYVEATNLIRSVDRVAGVIAVDQETGGSFEYRARVVINATGPWGRAMAHRFGVPETRIPENALAWNAVLNRDAPSQYALAVTPTRSGAQTYFLYPWQGKLLVGTAHHSSATTSTDPVVPESLLQSLLSNINDAAPALNLRASEILFVLSGLLPAKKGAKNLLAVREAIIDHQLDGGPGGFYTVSGVKFTTSRSVAEKTLRYAFPNHLPNAIHDRPPELGSIDGIRSTNRLPDLGDTNWRNAVRALIRSESVLHLDDLVLRRTALWENPESALQSSAALCECFDWEEQRRAREIKRLSEKLPLHEPAKNIAGEQ